MSLKRNTSQKKTLNEYYTEIKNSVSKSVGELMLIWIDRINSEFEDIEIWGLTSHCSLILQNENNYNSEKYIILNIIANEYQIEYLIPKNFAPFENAYVLGKTNSIDKAMEILGIAIKKE